MEKLNLYLNDDQYEKLGILAEENNMEIEEYANESFYNLLLANWLDRMDKEIELIFDNPNTDWED